MLTFRLVTNPTDKVEIVELRGKHIGYINETGFYVDTSVVFSPQNLKEIYERCYKFKIKFNPLISELTQQKENAVAKGDFEEATKIRDRINELIKQLTES